MLQPKYSRSALAVAICGALAAGQAHATTFNVTNNNDSGPGSLRQAIIDSNSVSGTNVIEMSAISGQTINLTGGQLYSYDNLLTINGAGVTIDAGGNSRVLYAVGIYTNEVTVNDLVITGGNAASGAGLRTVNVSLELNNSTITGNTATGTGGGHFHSGYGLEISDSVISANTAEMAGGIYSRVVGSTTIRDSVISGNSAEGGEPPEEDAEPLSAWFEQRLQTLGDRSTNVNIGSGGGEVGGAKLLGLNSPYSSSESSVVVERTVVRGNTADVNIGGIEAVSENGGVTISQSEVSGNSAGGNAGGGVLLGNSSVNVVNSTISANSAGAEGGGLGISVGGQLFGQDSQTRGFISQVRIDFSTIVGNSSGNAAGGLLLTGNGDDAESLINASVVSGNTAPVDPDLGLVEPEVAGLSGPIANMTFSLIGVDPSTGVLNKDAVSVSLTGENPLLGPLADNGGPTLTHLPLADSPLIDQVPEGQGGCGSPYEVDQRGSPRPFGDGCDIGAYELISFSVFSDRFEYTEEYPNCSDGLIADCIGGCSPDALIGDGSCDKEFNCEEFGWDGGDCSGP